MGATTKIFRVTYPATLVAQVWALGRENARLVVRMTEHVASLSGSPEPNRSIDRSIDRREGKLASAVACLLACLPACCRIHKRDRCLPPPAVPSPLPRSLSSSEFHYHRRQKQHQFELEYGKGERKKEGKKWHQIRREPTYEERGDFLEPDKIPAV